MWIKLNLNFKITFQNHFEYATKWVRAGCAPPPTPGFASVPAPPTQSDQNTRETQRSRGRVGQHFNTDGHDVTDLKFKLNLIQNFKTNGNQDTECGVVGGNQDTECGVVGGNQDTECGNQDEC